jgi:FkbM family methyltransferase
MMLRPLKRRLAGVLQNIKLARTFLNWWAFRSAESKRDAGETILKTWSGLKIAVRHNKWDTRIIWEQFIDRGYLARFQIPDGRPPVVVDIGSYIGDFALYCAHRLGAQVVAYEPAKENFEMLEKNLGLNPHLANRVTAVNRAVAATPEIVANVQVIGHEIHVSNIWYADDPAAERRTFACDTLSEILDRHGLHSVDLLKIDCEGSEYDIIPATPNECYDRIVSIVYEWHKTPGWESKLEAVERKLRAVGFTVTRIGQLEYATRT